MSRHFSHKRRPRGVSQLGELPSPIRAEREIQGKRILDPGAGFAPDWENPYSQSNFPFTIGTASQRIIPDNPLRCYLIIQNKSGGNLFVNFGQNATVFNGIQIIAGGNYELIGGSQGGAFCPADGIYIVGDAAGLDGVLSEGVKRSL